MTGLKCLLSSQLHLNMCGTQPASNVQNAMSAWNREGKGLYRDARLKGLRVTYGGSPMNTGIITMKLNTYSSLYKSQNTTK